MSEPYYTVHYIINGHERRTTPAHPIRNGENASESYILSEFQRLGRIVKVDGRTIKSVVVESIEQR
jgi:hypothetical protein